MKTNLGPLGMTFLAAIFVGIGLLVGFILGTTHQLRCTQEAGENSCLLTTKWMGLVTLRRTQFQALAQAETQESCDDSCTYRVMLHTANKSFPLDPIYTSEYDHIAGLTSEINDFLADPAQRQLSVQTGGGLWLLLVVPFLLVGLALAWLPLLTAVKAILRIKP